MSIISKVYGILILFLMVLIPDLEIMNSTALLLIKVVVDSLTCYQKTTKNSQGQDLFDLCQYILSLAG